MKSLLVLVISFVMQNALASDVATITACPDLSGTYRQAFPTPLNNILNIGKYQEERTQKTIYSLSIFDNDNTGARPWNWELTADGQSREKNMGALYQNVHEISRCEDRQLHVTLFGELRGNSGSINFTQEWIIYKNTSRELVWQINYRDDNNVEGLLSIYKYQPML